MLAERCATLHDCDHGCTQCTCKSLGAGYFIYEHAWGQHVVCKSQNSRSLSERHEKRKKTLKIISLQVFVASQIVAEESTC